MDLIGVATLRADVPRGTLRPELNIEKTAPSEALLGQPFVYTITIRNLGQISAHEVVVEDQIPKGTRLTGTIPRAQLKDKKLIWRLGTLAPGEETSIKVRVFPTSEGEIGSVTTVNFVAEITSATMITAPRLDLTLSTIEQAVVGEDVSLLYRVTNNGQGEAADVVLRSKLDDRLSHAVGKDLEYDVGLVRPGETKEVRLTVSAAKPGQAVTNATVTAKGGVSANRVAELEVIPSVLTVTRKGPTRRFVGREADYVTVVTNESLRDLRSIVIEEKVPAGMKFLAATNNGQYNAASNTVVWNMLGLAPRGSGEMTIRLMAESTGTQISTVAVRDSSGHEASVRTEIEVEGFASLGIREVNGKGPVAVGEQVTLRFFLKNRGSADATNAVFRVELPADLEFVNAKGPAGLAPMQGQIVSFNPVARLRPEDEVTFDLIMAARRPGDTRLKIAVQADQMPQPVIHEESVIIYAD